MSKTSRLAGSWVWVVARSPNGAVQSCSRLRFHSPVNPQYEGCDIGNVGDVHSIYVAFSKRILDRVELFCLLLKIIGTVGSEPEQHSCTASHLTT